MDFWTRRAFCTTSQVWKKKPAGFLQYLQFPFSGFNWTIVAVSASLVFFLFLIGSAVYIVQKKFMESEMISTSWKINYNEIVWINDRTRLCATLLAMVGSDDSEAIEAVANGNPRVVRCRGSLAWAKDHDQVPNWSGKLDSWHLKTVRKGKVHSKQNC